ncbi:hypothetical protein TIFTF001_015148 [Ficus carica]|uniref:Uncharacterized protein n=1 Tax=Ficus carica TaxID=3494 RepID=A0AA88A0Q8_FICCA|nr:hypothetical protein TIFTF001_015148 [Ficus carica]
MTVVLTLMGVAHASPKGNPVSKCSFFITWNLIDQGIYFHHQEQQLGSEQGKGPTSTGGENQLNEAIGLDACMDERWDASHRIKQLLEDLTRSKDVLRVACAIHSRSGHSPSSSDGRNGVWVRVLDAREWCKAEYEFLLHPI